jgi:hypothetical protein
VANFARPLSRRVDGILIAEYEHGEIGPDLFRRAAEVTSIETREQLVCAR